METVLMNDSEYISMITESLAHHFIKPLYDFYHQKNYAVYVNCFERIIGWAMEFNGQYADTIKDWGSFESSTGNIYAAADEHDFLMAWGKNKLDQFVAAMLHG